MAAGDQIILGLDANEDINGATIRDWIGSWGLVDAVTQTHPTLEPVATCNKNRTNIPIDGIWISPSLRVKAAGMTGFGEVFSDTDPRMLWMDINVESLFGFHAPPPARRPPRQSPNTGPTSDEKI